MVPAQVLRTDRGLPRGGGAEEEEGEEEEEGAMDSTGEGGRLSVFRVTVCLHSVLLFCFV